MRTRSQGLPLIEFDPDINNTCRNLRKQKKEEVVRMATEEQMQAMMAQMQAQMQQLKDAQAALEAQKQTPINEAFVPNYIYHEPPRVNANNFELKTGLINMVQQNQYGGHAIEDPNAHLAHFLELCSTIKMNGVPDDFIRLRLFPFSLRDKAKSWYHTLHLGDAISWEDMAHAFLRKFHPPGLTLKLKMDIVRFEQFEEEKLAETWERYQEKLRMCPSHGFDTGTLVIMFYNACGEQTRMHMDTAAGGSLLQKGSSEAWDIIESMAATSCQWPSERVQLKKVAAVSGSDSMEAFTAQLAEMNAKIAALSVRKTEPSIKDPSLEEANFVNGRGYENFQQVQPGMYNRGPQYPTGQRQFQPGGRPHPNLSYSNPNNAVQPPPGFSVSNGGVINEPKKDSLEEMMTQVLVKVTGIEANSANMGNRISNIENNFSALAKQVQMLETQVGQMANHAAMQNKLGQTEGKLKSQCNAIFEEAMSPEDDEAIDIFLASCEETSKEHESPSEEPYKAPPLREYIPKVPFPRSLGKFTFEKLYGRKLGKEVDTKEAKLEFLHDQKAKEAAYAETGGDNVKEEVLPEKDGCTELPMKLLPKKEDPGSFTIACEIGGELFPKALCDLGASVNVMPVSVFKRLGIGDLKPTPMEIQMADRSRVKPRGKIEDIFVKVDKLVFPTDFLVLDIPEDANPPLILGRSFLATGQAMIDVPNGRVVFRVGDTHEPSTSTSVGRSVVPAVFDVH